MIVWIASFPRSGNTFLRMLLNQRYGIRSGVVYDFDGVADRLGADFVGYTPRRDAVEALRGDSATHFIKTHRCASQDVAEGDAGMYLVRDGRDALVSWARQRTERAPQRYEKELEALIRGAGTEAGSWGKNVLSWFRHDGVKVVSFARLVREPSVVVDELVARVAADTAKVSVTIPGFDELHRADPLFFRRGRVGSFEDEMPARLEGLFWGVGKNREAMELLASLESSAG